MHESSNMPMLFILIDDLDIKSFQFADYILPNEEFVEKVQGFSSNQRGGHSMVDQKGYIYNLCHTVKNDVREFEKKSAWRCKLYNSKRVPFRCPARAWTRGDKILRFFNEHCHPSDIDPNIAPYDSTASMITPSHFLDVTKQEQ